MQRLFRRYAWSGALALLLVVAGIGALQGWRWYQAREAGRAAEVYLAAAELDGPAAAERLATVAAAAPAGYRTLARLREAGLRAAAGETAAALALWDQVARDGGVDALYRELAGVLWGLHALDGGDPAAIEARMAPLAEGTGPWRATAMEVRAIALLRRGDAAAARRSLTALANDATAAQGPRERAQRLLAGLPG